MKNGLNFAGQGGDDHSGWSTRAPSSTATTRCRRLRVDVSEKKDPSRTNADFARQATISAFGWLHARALDQADFRDRPPGQTPAPTPEASPL